MRPFYWLDRHLVTPALMLADNILPRSWRRRWWLTRDRWQHWIWSGRSISQRLAQHLPLYFSDPDWMTNRQVRRAMRNATPANVDTGTGPIRVRVVNTPGTYTSGTSATYTVDFPLARR